MKAPLFIARGGSWYNKITRARSAYRLYMEPDDLGRSIGIRLAMKPPKEKHHVLRGGSWYSKPARVRSVFRLYCTPGNRDFGLGFRLAMKVPKPKEYELRGGSWDVPPACVRSAFRGWYRPGNRLINLGFRLAMKPPDAKVRVLRGGSWNNRPTRVRSADRLWGRPGNRNYDLGYRLNFPHDLGAYSVADTMAFRYANFRIDQNMDIHQAIAAHASGAQHVQGDHIIDRLNGFCNLLDIFRLHRCIDEFLGALPGKVKTDFTHH